MPATSASVLIPDAAVQEVGTGVPGGTSTGGGNTLVSRALATGAAAATAAGDAAGSLQRKYAPAALGGTGADATYSVSSRTGADAGADPSPGTEHDERQQRSRLQDIALKA